MVIFQLLTEFKQCQNEHLNRLGSKGYGLRGGSNRKGCFLVGK